MLLSLLLCTAAVAATIALLQRSTQTLGLPLVYILTLSSIHLPGGLVHWLHSGDLPYTLQTEEGLRITAVCMVAFVAGIAFLECQQNRRLEAWAVSTKINRRDPLFWRFCTTCGLFIGFVLAPLRFLPSMGALIQNAGLLWIAGVLLAIRFHVSQAGAPKALLSWVGLSLINPFLSLFGQGFLGYGITAITQVYSQLLVRRPTLVRSLIIFALIFYLGLGVGVTYLATRSYIRDAVWGGRNASARIDAIGSTLSQVRLFDPADLGQAELIDLRLNQNYLVGAAAFSIEAGSSRLLLGRTISDAVIALIPRALWPGKPEVGGSGSLVTNATGIRFEEGTSVGIGSVLEAYVNFGLTGCIAIFVSLGSILRWLDLRSYRAQVVGNYRIYLGAILPGLAMMQPGGSFAEVSSSVAASWLAAILWFVLWQRYQKLNAKNMTLHPSGTLR